MMRFVKIIILLFFFAGQYICTFRKEVKYQEFVPGLQNLTEEQKSKIVTFFGGLSKIRTRIYGDMHAGCEIIKTEEKNAVIEKTREIVEFWSRDDRYYRVDVKTVESGHADRIGSTCRTIIHPDKAVTLLSKKPGAPFILMNRPNAAAACESLNGLEFYHGSTRLYCLNGVSLPEVLFLNGQNGVESALDKMSARGNNIMCEITCLREGDEQEVEFVFDEKTCCCISFRSKPKNPASRSFRRFVHNTYDRSSFGLVPVNHHEDFESDKDGVRSTMDINTSYVAFHPASLSVFDDPVLDDEAAPHNSPWTISALALLICLLIAVSYYRNTAGAFTKPNGFCRGGG